MTGDVENVLAADKRRAVARLRELEAEQRADVAQLRERLDKGASLRGIPAQVVAAEARADAFALARDIVEGKWF